MFAHLYEEVGHISMGNCSISNTVLPLNDTKEQLPNPSAGLTLKHIAIGRGTQNYSCPDASGPRSTTQPTAVGAAATLFDASCVAAQSLTLLHELPPLVGTASVGSLGFLAEALSLATNSTDLILGEHYFNADGDPVFDLRLGGSGDWAVTSKKASVDAPQPQDIHKGKSCAASKAKIENVAWLKLDRKSGTGIQEVYRVVTFEGSPPSSCAGQNSTVLVQYAAEYWFYG
ncbi:Protein of unknown function DUF3455 [Penicillium chermesinum]|uniref:Malate dehydrogenase n=1 Tax=Penicillium chermesinum TaxID=63820 RepID=A0A9W9TK14_9EURO|nr:Protein of unknown function DUF3455 [Penicillium chermesinum]KAJ5225681.1 Protein of unknown function DUF3455 [Penicillium chermesinum]KAJ6161100.1 Protein of unknown function DUF3455 [Penicillium chermesinum]